ncbi:MAG: DNA adenine methylase [Gaiellaceae bacterium]
MRLRGSGRGARVLAEQAPYQPKARPFLKWAGGKQWLVPLAGAFLPENFTGRYYEPFLGGGAVFFALSPPRATLGDSNRELVNAYTTLRTHPDAVVALLKGYPNNRDFYDELRDLSPETSPACAARLIYLNKTAFNGLYRVSRAGRFNVPYGRYANPTICNEPRLRQAASALRGVSLQPRPFTRTLAHARSGDFAYLDPPYITGHSNNGFLKYNAHLFAWPDQVKLAKQVHVLSNRGVRFAVTNADHAHVAALYGGMYGYRVARRSAIGGGIQYRGRVSELLVTNFPLFDVDVPTLP